MFRILYIGALFFKYFFLFSLLKYKFYKTSKPKLLRRFFEEAGGTFIKFGQLLAMRVDILSNEYSLELLDLFDNVGPFSYQEVEAIFLSELGATPNKIFKDFQKSPFASASFGQVHGAKLKDNTIVVVKVLRPDIEAQAQIDFLIIDFFAFMADLFFKIEALPWKEFASEFKTWTKQEFDYRIEAENGEKLYSNNSNPNIIIPKIYHDLTTKRILVEEYIEGFHLSRIFKRLKDGRLDEKKLKEMGVNFKKVLRVLLSELFKQFFLYDFYHADPHPGNIILLKNGKVGIIDFGIVGKEPMPNKNYFMKWAKATGDFNFKEASFYAVNFAGDEIKTMIKSALPATIDQKTIDDELMRLLADHFSTTVEKIITENQDNLRDMKKDYTVVLMQIVKTARRYKVKLPKEFVVFVRTMAVFSLLSKQMDSDLRITEEMKRFFQQYSEEELTEKKESINLKRINREVALERLNNWLSYLFEVDPSIYQLVKNYLGKYTFIDR